MPSSHMTEGRNVRQILFELTQVTGRDIRSWRETLPCISVRLEREIGSRRYRYGTSLDMETDNQTALEWMIHICKQAFETTNVYLWLASPEGNKRDFEPYMSPYSPDRSSLWKLHGKIIEVIARDQQSLLLPSSMSKGLGPSMVAPITLGDSFVGAVLTEAGRSSEEYSNKDLETLEFIIEATTVCCHLAAQSRSETRTLSEIGTSLDRGSEEHRDAA